MKVSAISFGLAFVLPAVLALPQSKDSLVDKILGGKAKADKATGDLAVSTNRAQSLYSIHIRRRNSYFCNWSDLILTMPYRWSIPLPFYHAEIIATVAAARSAWLHLIAPINSTSPARKHVWHTAASKVNRSHFSVGNGLSSSQACCQLHLAFSVLFTFSKSLLNE